MNVELDILDYFFKLYYLYIDKKNVIILNFIKFRQKIY